MRRTTMRDFELYALYPDGPRQLDLPDGVSDPSGLLREHQGGVYTRFRTYGGERFLGLEEHLARLDLSLSLAGHDLRIELPAVRRAIAEIVPAYTKDGAPSDAFVRIDVLVEATPFVPPGPDGTVPSVLLSLSPFVPVPEPLVRDGVGVEFADLKRTNPRAKATRFAYARLPHPRGTQEEFERLLVSADGNVLEGTSSNFFACQGDLLRTPRDGMLLGVTRGIVLRLAEQAGMRIDTEVLPVDELGAIDEAFLTSSSRGVLPIVRIAGKPVGDGRPGPWTRRLQEALRKLEDEARPAV